MEDYLMTDTQTRPSSRAARTPRFHFRRPDPATDVPGLVALGRAVEAVDQVDNHPSEAQVRDSFAEPGYDAAQDSWVVENPDNPAALIGESWAFHVGNSARAFVGSQVDPAWRGHGIGAELLARALTRAEEQGSNRYVSCGFDDKLVAAQRLMDQFGFRRVVGWVLLRLPADHAAAAPAWPAGYTLRPYNEVNDPTAVQEALNRGFIGHWENRDRPLEDIIHRLHGPHANPAGILLASGPAGDIAGICWAGYDPDYNAAVGEAVGYIHNLGVVPEHRRAGLGRALLLAGIAWLRSEGQAVIELDAMGNNELALPLYEGVGFTVKRQGSEYRLDLT